MKPTTLNFWCGVLVGAFAVTFIPGYVKGFKQGFKEGFLKEVKDDHSKPIIDNRGAPYTDGTKSDSESISKLKEVYDKIASEYQTKPENENDLKNVVKFGVEDPYGNGYVIDPGFIQSGMFDPKIVHPSMNVDNSILNGSYPYSITADSNNNTIKKDTDDDEFKGLDS